MKLEQIWTTLANETQISMVQVKATLSLLEAGNTVPFVARYRKEQTGSLNENQIRVIAERFTYLKHLGERQHEVLRKISAQNRLTDEVQQAVLATVQLQELEDLYRPFQQKRKSRATKARERGLEGLAQYLLSLPQEDNLLTEFYRYLGQPIQAEDLQSALQGAVDILAEQIADDPQVRTWVRRYGFTKGIVEVEKKAAEPVGEQTYQMYYQYSEPVVRILPHRILAINRGEKEGFLKVKIKLEPAEIIRFIENKYIYKSSPTENWVRSAVLNAYSRLLAPAVERAVRRELTQRAESQALRVFATNLRQLLLQPPVKGKRVLGLDPAYRTGCKWAAVEDTGKLLSVGVVYPTPPHPRVAESEKILTDVLSRFGIQVIAIGNGTASRETEEFVVQMLPKLPHVVAYTLVSEAGASVYSASKLAGAEFPQLDVSQRSAISIARRLQDPLAELVKIDPQSIGVGQYQHDLRTSNLADELQFVVESAVNHVGVDVNTASVSLLQYVSGVSPQVAQNIVAYREEHGKFRRRTDLLQVPRLGEKTYEQCIGFLRIRDGDTLLDNTPIHPESYANVNRLLTYASLYAGLPEGAPEEISMEERLRNLPLDSVAKQLEIGEPTLRDIVEGLLRPGRDPREDLPQPLLRKDVLTLENLEIGMELQGTVRNVVDFGAFVDIGLKNDALVHISKIAQSFVLHPLDRVSVGQVVTVWVAQVDAENKRVSLTMVQPVPPVTTKDEYIPKA